MKDKAVPKEWNFHLALNRQLTADETHMMDTSEDLPLTVLKQIDGPLQPGTPDPCFALPPSPLR